ncbi:MAG: YggS family pyridoxal phosphate-dependent enzyme [Alphaproteobacteria bacterium]
MTSQETLEAAAIAERLSGLRGLIGEAAAGAGRRGEDVTLIAISKKQPAHRIEAALAAGQRVFGENRVQEAAARWPELRARYDAVSLHLVGPLQTNKVSQAVELFQAIHTLDRDRLARALARERDRRPGRSFPDLFIQVNTGEEPQKSGVAPADLPALHALAAGELGLPVIGLMCLPPVDEPPAVHFAFLAKLAGELGLPGLSMGMSDDVGIAVRLGATHVRVGTGIFGPRPDQP